MTTLISGGCSGKPRIDAASGASTSPVVMVGCSKLEDTPVTRNRRKISRIGRDESTCRSPAVGRLPSQLDERLLSRIAGSRMWFAAKTRQVMAYRIQTDP